jgi:hypothetical protein
MGRQSIMRSAPASKIFARIPEGKRPFGIHSHRLEIILSSVGVTTDGVLDWMIGFIYTKYTALGTTGNYSAIADLHTL